MKDFELWFAYYDSLFINEHPKLTDEFFQDHFISEADWPFHISHSLSTAYQALEKFITNSSNWVISQCSKQELLTIQTEIDDLLHFIYIEKSYAFVFWHRDPRRIEASILHLYSFLQLLIKAFIPYSSMTVFECKSANKLCINFFNLEKLMKEILTCVNPLAKFLSGKEFKEEESIVENFFENLVAFMKKLPKIKKNKLPHIHNLAKFMTLTNPIEICAKKHDLTGIRKKSNTFDRQTNLSFNLNLQEGQLYALEFIKKEKYADKRFSSCPQFYVRKSTHNNENLTKEKKEVLFRLPDYVIKNSIQTSTETKEATFTFPPLNSIRKKGCSINSISKNQTVTTNETITISPPKFEGQKRQKAKSTFQRMYKANFHKRPSVGALDCSRENIQRRETRFYYDEYERDEERMSLISEKEGETRHRQLSIINNYVNVESALRLKSNKDVTFFDQNKLNFSIGEGIVCESKWGIIRDYLNEKIKERKIEKIMKGQL